MSTEDSSIIHDSDIDEIERLVTNAIKQAVATSALRTDSEPQAEMVREQDVIVDHDGDTSSTTIDLSASSDLDSLDSISEIIRSRRSAWTAEELGDLTSLSKQHIYRLAKAGRMPSHRIGGAVRFDSRATADWWDSKATG